MRDRRPKAAAHLCKDVWSGLDMDSSVDESDVTVREMAPGDAQAVSLLSEQLGYERSAHAILDWIGALATGPGHERAAFVACCGDDVVGWIEVSIERRLQSPPFALIGGLVVKEGIRGRGIGRRLCAWAEAWAWERSVETVRVTSRSTRFDAHRFYLRDGYHEVKTSLVFEKSRPR
jgi:GNAT superfamily N-acetyltransferase